MLFRSGPLHLGFQVANAKNTLRTELVVVESRCNDVILVLDFLEVTLRTKLDFAPELVHQLLVVRNDVEKNDLLLIHQLKGRLELLLGTFITSLKMPYFRLIVLNNTTVLMTIRMPHLRRSPCEPLR